MKKPRQVLNLTTSNTAAYIVNVFHVLILLRNPRMFLPSALSYIYLQSIDFTLVNISEVYD